MMLSKLLFWTKAFMIIKKFLNYNFQISFHNIYQIYNHNTNNKSKIYNFSQFRYLDFIDEYSTCELDFNINENKYSLILNQ